MAAGEYRATIQVRRDRGLDRVISALPGNAQKVAENYVNNVTHFATVSSPVLTGRMKQSISKKQTGPHSYVAWVGVYYGVYVNFGTRHQQPQPFWSTSVAQAKALLAKDMAKVFDPRGII